MAWNKTVMQAHPHRAGKQNDWGSLTKWTRHPRCFTWAKPLGSSPLPPLTSLSSAQINTVWRQLCSLLLLKKVITPPQLAKTSRVSPKSKVSTWGWISELWKSWKFLSKTYMKCYKKKDFFKETHHKVVDSSFLVCVVDYPDETAE